MIKLAPIRDRFVLLSPHLDERERRLLAATEARAAGYGGIAAVARATGIAVSTIGRGLRELRGATDPAEATRVRRHGGGRKLMHPLICI
jgi:DNA-binding phage protein